MSEWRQQKLEHCAEILDHLRIPVNEEQRSKDPGNTPYYGANGLQGYIDGWIFDEPLILMAEDGGYFDEFADRPVAYRISGKSWVNNHAHILRPKPIIDFDFLFYSLEHKDITPFIKGGTRAKLNQKELREIEVFVPQDKNRQRKIAAILHTIDQAIEKTEALIEKYGQIKAGMMHDLFTRGLTPDGKLRPPRDQAPELYKETPIGWIPKEWEYEAIETIKNSLVDGPFGSNLKTEHYVVDPGVRVVRLQNIEAGLYNDRDRAFVSDRHALALHRNQVVGGDILIAGLGEERYPVARACLYPEQLPAAINKADCFRLRCDEGKMINAFMMHFLNIAAARKQVRRYEQGVTRPRINLGNMNRILTPKPSVGEQQQVVNKLSSLVKSIEFETAKCEKLYQQKSGLMHDLLTGKVAVKVDEAEAAHV